jgi:hypothetical protein
MFRLIRTTFLLFLVISLLYEVVGIVCESGSERELNVW